MNILKYIKNQKICAVIRVNNPLLDKHMSGEYSSVTPTTKKDETSPKKKPFLGFFRGK